MSNLSDLKKIGDNDTSALEATGIIFGTLADFSGAIGFVQLGVDTIEGFFSHDSDVQGELEVLQASLTALHGQLAASDKLQRMRDIDNGINDAFGVFEQLRAILSSDPPVSQADKLSAIRTCQDAALFFDNDEKWQTVWADMNYYSDHWSNELAPEAGPDGLVFDYIYTLPQFLRAIYFFLTAVGALSPLSLPYYRDPLTRILGRLETVHATIVDGIVATRIPTAEEIGYITPDARTDTDNNDLGGWFTAWFNGESAALINGEWVVDGHPERDPSLYYPYGAIEIYSGVGHVRSYWEDFFPYKWGARQDVGPTGVTDNFISLLQLRITRVKKELYDQIGLPVVRYVINELRNLVGLSPLTDKLYDHWSVDEVSSILNLPRPGVTTSGPIWIATENSLETFLQNTPPYSGIDVYSPQVHSENSAWMPPRPLPSGSLYHFLTGDIPMEEWLEPIMYIMMS
jgi:hypothetical protein